MSDNEIGCKLRNRTLIASFEAYDDTRALFRAGNTWALFRAGNTRLNLALTYTLYRLSHHVKTYRTSNIDWTLFSREIKIDVLRNSYDFAGEERTQELLKQLYAGHKGRLDKAIQRLIEDQEPQSWDTDNLRPPGVGLYVSGSRVGIRFKNPWAWGGESLLVLPIKTGGALEKLCGVSEVSGMDIMIPLRKD